MRFAWSAVLVAGLASSAYANTGDGDENKTVPAPSTIDQGDRIRKLEIEIERLKEDRAHETVIPTSMALDSQDKAAPKSEVEFKASFTDGFHIKSTDGNFDLHIGGRWEEEYRYTFNRHVDGAVRTSANSFYAREAFISLDGTIYKNWGFKLNGDFSQPQTSGTGSSGAIIEEAYVEWKELKEFRILFGSFKQPVSMEITDSPRFSELIQRSPMARFMPNFDTGIKAFGSFMDSMLTYELAVTNGRSHLANQGRDNVDDNDGKEFAARFTTAPFVQDKESFLKGLRVGVYGTFAHEGQGNPVTGVQPAGWPGGVATNELGVTYLAAGAFPGTFHFHGDRYRVGGELTYAVGPFMMRGEVSERHDEVFTAGGKNNLLATAGYYGEAVYVLTGEDRIPNARLVPLHPFSLADGGFGAVEIAARVGTAAMDRKVLIDDGVNMAGNSNRARSMTLGFNWWPVQNVKFSLDYIGEFYFYDIALSGTHSGSHANGMLARFQVDF